MKVLMISAGLTPKRSGGLVAYVEELIQELRQHGNNVVYLDMNATDGLGKPRITKSDSGFTHYTLHNSSIYIGYMSGTFGTYEPLREVYPSKRCKEVFLQVVEAEQPDVIHLHELIGFPVALIEALKKNGYKIIFTAQDYFAVCPTVKLFTHDSQVCQLKASELICNRCCDSATFNWINQLDVAVKVIGKRHTLVERTWNKFRRYFYALARRCHRYLAKPSDYSIRRLEFSKYLKQADVIICMSKLQYCIFSDIMGHPTNLRQMYLSRRTYRSLPMVQNRRKSTGDKTVFIALNVNSEVKGLDLLLNAFSKLSTSTGNWELRIYGGHGESNKNVRYFGSYTEADLDVIAGEADYGIVPSLWQEAYGYVGPEMLTRGLPLIVSSRGAMTEYIQHGKNGWVFDPEHIDELVKLLQEIISSKVILKSDVAAVKFPTFEDHVIEMENLYHQVICANDN